MPTVIEPTTNWGIIGHEWAVRLLQSALTRGQLLQAYLFLGPPRIGKTTLALALARAINCTGDAPPCGHCRSCTLTAAGRHPDVRLIVGGEVRAILIDQVRQIQREIMLSPVEARRRVVILSDFQGATTEAANCLLKTLEEPPANAVLILTATQEGRLLPTIVSRCQPLWLRPPAGPAIAQGLERHYGATPDLAARLARLSAGRVGWAVQATGDAALLKEREEQLDRIREISGAGLPDRLHWARELSTQSDRLPALLDLWLGWWRDILLWRTGCSDLISNVDRETVLAEAAQMHDVPDLLAGLQELKKARRRLESNANPRLTLEVLFMTIGRQAQRIG